mgnify:CR=1 FL=1
MVALENVLQPPKESKPRAHYCVQFEHYAVGDRGGILTCLIRDNRAGRFVGGSSVTYEQSAPHGDASRRDALSFVIADSLGTSARDGGVPLFKSWEQVRQSVHALAVSDARSNGHHLVLVEGGDM